METYGSKDINGQLIPVIGNQAIKPPQAVGPYYSGPGQSPLATIPLATGGYAHAGVGAAASATAGGPGGRFGVWLILAAMFAVGVIGLRYVHWRGK